MLYDPKWEAVTPPAVKTEPWQDVLLRAADLIDWRGWCQHKLEDEGRMCALGAIIMSSGYATQDEYVAHLKLEDLVGRRIDAWNDAPERTKEEVIATLRQAASEC